VEVILAALLCGVFRITYAWAIACVISLCLSGLLDDCVAGQWVSTIA
jgi:hypothetical protein